MNPPNAAVPSRSRESARRRCVVIESGSFPFAQAEADDFDETMVIAQLRDEQPGAFARRFMGRLAAAERSGRRFEVATILTSDADDAESAAARRLIALGLSAHGEAGGGMTELMLSARPRASLEVRFALLGLVEEVLASTTKRSVPVRLRFGDPDARLSGVFRVMSRERA